MHDFKGRVALVTGGTSGIGRATAIAFARAGANVAVAGRRQAEGEGTVRLAKQAGGQAIFIRADVGKAAEVEAMVKKTVAAFGRLDFAFNNAGVEGAYSPITEQTEGNYDLIFDANVRGVFLSMKYEIPAMLKSGGGAIVNTSSVAGHIAFPNAALYTASKHAVIGMTKAAALEYGKSNIRVNAVSPAAIETDMLRRFIGGNAGFRAELAAMHPLGRIGEDSEIAGPVLWLCSSAASFVTGQAIPIDGGYTSQ